MRWKKRDAWMDTIMMLRDGQCLGWPVTSEDQPVHCSRYAAGTSPATSTVPASV
jgi:hypothetical protein